MHCHCQLSNLSSSHTQLPLNDREVAAPGTGTSLSTCTFCQTAAVRDTYLPAAEASLVLSSIQSVLQPAMASSFFPKNISSAPSSTQPPLPQAARHCDLARVGRGKACLPHKVSPMASLRIHKPGRQTMLASRAAERRVVSNANP